jgi:GT2 family glycosyltransferase
MKPTVSILIPSFNGWHLLEPCLESIRQLDYPGESGEVIVIDNASTDGTAEKIEKRFPGVRILRSEENLGFAPALTQAASKVSSKYLAFLNNDTRIDPHWLSGLVDALESEEARRMRAVAACGAILSWEGDGVQFFGGHINFLGKAFHHCPSLEELNAAPAVEPAFYACGAGMLIDREIFLKSGGFDEDYFMIFEDVDLGWRLNLMGLKTLLVRDARIYHREGASLNSLDYAKKALWWERNALWTIYKNYSKANLEKIWPAALAMAFKRNRILVEAGRQQDFERHHHGVTAAIRGLDRLKQKRARVQAARRVPDEELIPFFPDPFRVWAYGEDHYRLFADGQYAIFRDDCLNRFKIRPIFNR